MKRFSKQRRRDFVQGLITGILFAAAVSAALTYLFIQKVRIQAALEVQPKYETREIDSITYLINLRDYDRSEDGYWLIQKAAGTKRKICRLITCFSDPINVQIVYRRQPSLMLSGSTAFNKPLAFPTITDALPENNDQIKYGFFIKLKGDTIKEAAETLAHEMAHVLFWHNRFNKSHPPSRGVDEAMAILAEGKLVPRAFRAKKLFNVRQILTSTSYPSAKIKQSQFYDDASALLLFLLTEKGGLKPWKNFIAVASQPSRGFTEKTFKDAYNLTLSQLEKEWENWLEKNRLPTFEEWLTANYPSSQNRFRQLYQKLLSNRLSPKEIQELQKLTKERHQYKNLWQKYRQPIENKWKNRLEKILSTEISQ